VTLKVKGQTCDPKTAGHRRSVTNNHSEGHCDESNGHVTDDVT